MEEGAAAELGAVLDLSRDADTGGARLCWGTVEAYRLRAVAATEFGA